ncbi:AAA domain-containing protein [Sporosarcina sp. 179-K 3D1 HS]|uniref:DEAD/DEAH box helicase n=1 Tax=Sporosarcina sp. 179-K 3D1 HS TaxID=3232169 RepID=UPI0039A2D709
MTVNQQVLIKQEIQCALKMTDNARKGFSKFIQDEHAFFAMQRAFDVHIEKRPVNKHGNLSFSIFFDNETNEALATQLNARVAVMECVYQNDGFLATGFHVRGRKEPVRTNRRLPVRLQFQLGRNVHAPLPIELYTSLRELPIADERSEYVQKRIASWEGYLRIQERNADVEDVTASFAMSNLNKDFTRLRLICNGLKAKEWKTITGFSAKFKGQQQDIGNVVQVNTSQNLVEIELNRRHQEMARRQEWPPTSYNEVVFSNFAELSQVRRLRKGFKDLQDGLAANSNLEKILFEERPVVRISKQQLDLDFHNRLNEFQREAVTGAMTANDIYVIQGPPGTGKTTVISEICHQNVKAGLRTLVASQANLAVDNALGRLLSHQDIRILRYGRTESIEEEGKRFIEENVASHWRDQTLLAIQEHLQAHARREAQLEQDIRQCEQQYEQNRQELERLMEQIRLKKEAQIEQQSCSKELDILAGKKKHLQNELDNLVKVQEELNRSAEQIAEDIKQTEQFLHSNSSSPEMEKQMEELTRQITDLQNEIRYRELLQQMDTLNTSLEMNYKKIEMEQSRITLLQGLSKALPGMTKLDVLQHGISEVGIIPTNAIKQSMMELSRLIETIQSEPNAIAYTEWIQLNDRLSKAMETIQRILESQGFWKQALHYPIPASRRHTSPQDINALIDSIGRYLVKPAIKQTLALRTYAPQKYEILEHIATAFNLLKDRKKFTESQLTTVEQTKTVFLAIKEGLIDQVNHTIAKMDQEMIILQAEVEKEENRLQDFRQLISNQLATVGTLDETVDLTELVERLKVIEKTIASYEESKELWNQKASELEGKKKDQLALANQTESNEVSRFAITEEVETCQNKMDSLQTRLQELEDLLAQQPEAEHHRLLTENEKLSKQMGEMKREQSRLPMTKALQQEWVTLLTDATDYDLDEIRKLYVRHANVIGTTCVASARRDFMEEYPDFDVVIIDEVSKATPPELLLPMLKGKKIILVGDHHQLPPLVGQETMEEFLEEIDDRDEKRELEALLKESLFERLFRTLPKQNKTMLGIQYRMHESIMETIAHFYKEGDSRLLCGLDNSDSVRDHLLESRFVKRKDHLLWFDMPNEPKFFEEKVKGGTSLYNQAELTMIRTLLEDLDDATEKAKRAGRMGPDDRKSIGVISFYGEQVKRIDRLIHQELMPEHLHCRTGSVDKFQGMEMDVILLSFVRNHQEKGGSIGFAKDYRRLNVALSRARELLIVVGSSEMFTIRTKDLNTREMYGRLLAEMIKNQGLRDHEGNTIV